MGIIIKPSEEKKIRISGTDMELNEIYGRVDFFGRQDGRTVEIATTTYVNKQNFIDKKPIFTDIPQNNFILELQEGQEQNIQTILHYTKLGYEQLGYNVTIETKG